MITLLALVLSFSWQKHGIADFRMQFSVTDWSKYREQYSVEGFAIVQGYIVDTIKDFPQIMLNAWNAGYTDVDVVITPC